MSLLALQRDFSRHLTDRSVREPRLLDTTIAPGLAVYHNAYRVQLADCLAETFAHSHAWLGDDAFMDAARAHVAAWPPTGWTLGAYGARFAQTLSRLLPHDPEVAELARLEWQLSRAFEAANVEALPVEAIAGIDWDSAGLCFVPTLQALPALTNAGAIWSALAAGDTPPAAQLLPEAATLLVWRQDLTPCFRTVETIEHAAIERLAAGAGFAAICAELIDARGEAEGVALAGAMLGQWFRDGLVLKVTQLTD